MTELNEVAEKVRQVDDGVNNIIVPLLKDTIEDSNRHNKRLFVLNVLLTISMLVVAIISLVLVMIQNQKYAEFLSQFEFEGESNTIYQSTNDYSDINDGIKVIK